jgi:ubiquinone/menaquinone biosynthesis C-methylase UbiE
VVSGNGVSVRRVYDRTARIYDVMGAPMEWMGGARRRRRVLSRARGRVLEVGVGTGASFEHYPAGGIELHGLDISEPMLRRARSRAARLGIQVRLEQGDAEALPYADDSFDTVTATCVFCSVPDPVRGLRELGRVVRPDGRILLLEHVRPENPVLGRVFDLLSPLTRRLMGPEINRRTEANVVAAGLEIVGVRRDGVWREIEARPSSPPGTGGPAAAAG